MKINLGPDELSLDEIPKEILDELHKMYNKVSFELGSGFNETTQTFKAQYQRTLFDGKPQKTFMCDPDTFEPIGVIAEILERYIIRGDIIDNSSIIVRRVMSHKFNGEPLKVLGKLESIQDGE